MIWILSKLEYTQNTTFSGIDTIQLVVQDSGVTYSDPITIKVVMMQMPCLHGGECLGMNTYMYIITRLLM